jgi:hypothetical protein
MGPRPMEAAIPAVPSVPEEYEEHRDYVPPELLEDDRSTVIASGGGSQGGAGGVRAINPSTSVGPLARARGEGSGSTAVPYSSPRRDYANEEEADDDHLAASPLVGGTSAPVPYSSVHSSSNASQSRPQGYAAVGEDGDDYDDGGAYAAYSRSRDADLESKAGMGAAHGDRDASGATGTTLVGGAMGYLKNFGSSRSEKERSSFYSPHELAFTPPHDSSYPPPQNGLQKLPSLDVAGPYTGGFTGQGGDPSQIRPKPLWQRWFWDTTLDERRVWEHQRGVGMQRWPYASWLLAVVMVAVRHLSPLSLSTDTRLPSPSFASSPPFSLIFHSPTFALRRCVLTRSSSRLAGYDLRACQDEQLHRISHPDQAQLQRHDRCVVGSSSSILRFLSRVRLIHDRSLHRSLRRCAHQPRCSLRWLHEIRR